MTRRFRLMIKRIFDRAGKPRLTKRATPGANAGRRGWGRLRGRARLESARDPHLPRRLVRSGFHGGLRTAVVFGICTGMDPGDRTRLIHAICTYYGQWLPGDQRGWRSRDHRVHSSGDYMNPPPCDEHERLRHHARLVMSDAPVRLAPREYPMIGRFFLTKLLKTGSSVRCLSAGSTHVHLLFDSVAIDVVEELGRAKQFASLKYTGRRGRFWGRGAKIIVVDDVDHARRVWRYILDHAVKEGAWTWRYDRDEPPGLKAGSRA